MKFPVLSHSWLSTYERCPRQAYHKYVLKDVPFQETQAIKWGNEVHKAFEFAVNEKKPFPEGMNAYSRYLSALGKGCKAEVELGWTNSFTPCGFWEEKCYFRGKIDVLKIEGDKAFIVDWKTGKKWEDREELDRHATLVQAHFPHVRVLTGLYVWLKTGEIGKTYELDVPSAVGKIASLSAKLVRDLASDDIWPAKPNKLCPWCPVKSCRHNPEFER